MKSNETHLESLAPTHGVHELSSDVRTDVAVFTVLLAFFLGRWSEKWIDVYFLPVTEDELRGRGARGLHSQLVDESKRRRQGKVGVNDEHPGAFANGFGEHARATFAQDGVCSSERVGRRRDHRQVHRLHETRTGFEHGFSNSIPDGVDDLSRNRPELILSVALIVLQWVFRDVKRHLHSGQGLIAQRTAIGRHLKSREHASLHRV